MTTRVNNPDAFKTISFRQVTPDGTMFVQVLEDSNGAPFQILINIGKAGAAVGAWAHALANIVSAFLQNGASVNDVIHLISSITTDKVRQDEGGVQVRSGPEGICVALMRYRSEKYAELTATLDKGRFAGRLDD